MHVHVHIFFSFHEKEARIFKEPQDVLRDWNMNNVNIFHQNKRHQTCDFKRPKQKSKSDVNVTNMNI